MDEKNNNQKATIRWFLSGKHSKDSEEFGKKTDKDLFIMGINHTNINVKTMDKIKTTHVGSLPRSKKLSEILFKKDKNELFDQGELDEIIEEDVNKIV